MIAASGLLHAADYLVLGGFMVVMLSIALICRRRWLDPISYFRADHRAPWFLNGISIYMGSFSAATLILYAGIAAEDGWKAMFLYWLAVPAGMVTAIVFVPRWWLTGSFTPTEFLDHRFGAPCRRLLSAQGLLLRWFEDVVKLYALGYFLSRYADLPATAWVAAAGVCALVYTAWGGMWAVLIASGLQFLMLIAGLGCLLWLTASNTVGLPMMVHIVLPDGPGSAVQGLSPLMLLTGLLLGILNYGAIGWSLVQRYGCVASEAEANRSAWLAVGLHAITPPLVLVPVLAARLVLPTGDTGADLYANLWQALLPSGLLGLLIAGLLGATMGFIAGDFNVCAAVIMQEWEHHKPIDSGYASIGRGRFVRRATLLFGGSVLLGALLLSVTHLPRTTAVLDRFALPVVALAGVTLAAGMLAGLLSSRATGAAVLTAVLGGLQLGTLMAFFCPEQTSFLWLTWTRLDMVVWGTAISSLSLLIAISRLDNSTEETLAFPGGTGLPKLEATVGPHLMLENQQVERIPDTQWLPEPTFQPLSIVEAEVTSIDNLPAGSKLASPVVQESGSSSSGRDAVHGIIDQ